MSRYSYMIFIGGPLTVTDANLALGRLLPSFFPRIFGPGEDEPLSSEETMEHFQQLTREINHFLSTNQSQSSANGSAHSNNSRVMSGKSEMSMEEVAMGFIRVANEAMCRPIRALTQVLMGGIILMCLFCVVWCFTRDIS